MGGVRNVFERVLEYVVIFLVAALAIEVTLGVVFRSIGSSLVWYDEVASILLAWLTFYGAALAAVKRSHISCPELVAMMPRGVRIAITIGVEVLVIGFFALMGWTGWQVLEVLATDSLVSLPSISVRTVQSVIPISAVLIIIGELLTIPQALAWARTEHSGDPPAPLVPGEAAR